MEKISKNYYKGDIIFLQSDLQMLARESKSVYNSKFGGLKPAAIYMSMQYSQVNNLIRNGHLYFALSEQEYLIKRINEYLIDEDFPKEHLKALHDLIVRFNWSEESENEIFKFIKQITEKYNSNNEV